MEGKKSWLLILKVEYVPIVENFINVVFVRSASQFTTLTNILFIARDVVALKKKRGWIRVPLI
jgi:hypothetical protein